MRPSQRSRQRILILQTCIIAVGIWSRVPGGGFPFPHKEFGDTLWATMFYLWIVLIAPRLRICTTAGITIAITFAMEFLKLYHAPWIDSLRARTISGFLLGHKFYWHDLTSYLIGTALGVAADLGLIRRRTTTG